MCAATLVWFRLDLRLADNPALAAAAARGGRVLPIFIWAPEEEGDWPPGAASRWWLHQSLRSLAAAPYFRIFNPQRRRKNSIRGATTSGAGYPK